MKPLLKIILINIFIAFLATGMVWATDDTDTDTPADSATDDTDTSADSATDDTDIPSDSEDSRWEWEKAKEYAEEKLAEFKAKMEECKALRTSVKECIQASGIDLKSDRETIKSTIDGCLMEAGIDVEAGRAEAEARRAEFEAMRAEFEAKAAAIKVCMQESGIFDLENFDPENLDADTIKETMTECLQEAGIDLDALKGEFDATD